MNWMEEARGYGASHDWLLAAAPSEVREFCLRERALRTLEQTERMAQEDGFGGSTDPYERGLERWSDD